MPESDALRLFVAVELRAEVREALGRLQHELQRRGLEHLRWVRPEGIHLTLKFLGATPAERVPAIKETLLTALAGMAAGEVKLGSLGTFGGSRPGVLWLDLDGDVDALRSIQDRIEHALSQIGFQRERRVWSPHLTLARVRPETAREAATRIAAAIGLTETRSLLEARIAFREVSLMRSSLRPSGAVYERVATFPLGGA